MQLYHPQRAAEADDMIARRLDHVLDLHVSAPAALAALVHLQTKSPRQLGLKKCAK